MATDDEGPYRSGARWNEDQPIARRRRHRGGLVAVLGGALGGTSAGLVGIVAPQLGVTLALLGAIVFGVVGHALGRRRRDDLCSACGAPLPQGSGRCERCGGRVVAALLDEADEQAWLARQTGSSTGPPARVS